MLKKQRCVEVMCRRKPSNYHSGMEKRTKTRTRDNIFRRYDYVTRLIAVNPKLYFTPDSLKRQRHKQLAHYIVCKSH